MYSCSSTLLTTRLGISESVSKNIGTFTDLRREAQMNTQSSGEALSQEVINPTDAKVRSLRLAYSDFNELARQERAITTNLSTINSFVYEADDMYTSALRVIGSTGNQVSNMIS